jgi:hypothetical protein
LWKVYTDLDSNNPSSKLQVHFPLLMPFQRIRLPPSPFRKISVLYGEGVKSPINSQVEDSSLSAAHNVHGFPPYLQVVSFICKLRPRHAIVEFAKCACYFQKLCDQLPDRDPYFEKHDAEHLPTCLWTRKCVILIHYTWLSQLSRHSCIRLLASRLLISSSARGLFLISASVLHDLVGKR